MEATQATEEDPGRERPKGKARRGQSPGRTCKSEGVRAETRREEQGLLFGCREGVFKDGNGYKQSVGVKSGSRGRCILATYFLCKVDDQVIFREGVGSGGWAV